MSRIIAALQYLAAASRPTPEVPDTDLDKILPTAGHANALKAADSSTLHAALVKVLRDELNPLLTRAANLGVLAHVETEWDFPSPPDPTDLTSCGDADPGNNRVDAWNRRLVLTSSGRTLLQEMDTKSPEAVADSILAASDTGQRMRRVRDALEVVGRWVAAAEAAAFFGSGNETLATILALYRVEGDLAIPRSTQSLRALVPAHIETAPQDAFARVGKLLQLSWNSLAFDPAFRAGLSEDDLRKISWAGWQLHLGGLDLIVVRDWPAATLADLWNHATSEVGGAAIAAAQLQTKIDDVRNTMTVERAKSTGGILEAVSFSSPAPGASSLLIRTSPEDPVKMVSVVLGIAFSLFQHFRRVDQVVPGVPANLRWSDDAAYLLYNNQIQADLGGDIPHSAILGSAAGSLARWNGYRAPTGALASDFSALRTALRAARDAAHNELVDPTPLSTAAVAMRNGPVVAEWLRTAPSAAEAQTRVDQLSRFLSRAGSAQWGGGRAGYPEHRCNASRFRLLRAFYRHRLS